MEDFSEVTHCKTEPKSLQLMTVHGENANSFLIKLGVWISCKGNNSFKLCELRQMDFFKKIRFLQLF